MLLLHKIKAGQVFGSCNQRSWPPTLLHFRNRPAGVRTVFNAMIERLRKGAPLRVPIVKRADGKQRSLNGAGISCIHRQPAALLLPLSFYNFSFHQPLKVHDYCTHSALAKRLTSAHTDTMVQVASSITKGR